MSHNFVEQASGAVRCSQCGETREALSDPARFVDGVPPRCLFAPLGNELSHPVHYIIISLKYLSTPILFNEINTIAACAVSTIPPNFIDSTPLLINETNAIVSIICLFSDSSSPSDRHSTW